LDLTRNEALKVAVKKFADADYLFIESGGFSTRNPKGWKPTLYVMEKETP
jgi:hypothetical protein